MAVETIVVGVFGQAKKTTTTKTEHCTRVNLSRKQLDAIIIEAVGMQGYQDVQVFFQMGDHDHIDGAVVSATETVVVSGDSRHE